MHKIPLKVAASIFLIVALAHLARNFWGIEILIRGWAVPHSLSWIAAAAGFVLSFWMFRVAKSK